MKKFKKYLKNRLDACSYTIEYARIRARQALGTMQEQESAGDDSRLFFVTGFDKSGTTWLQQMFDSHPALTCRGSGQFFNFFSGDHHFLKNKGGFESMKDSVLNDTNYRNSGHVWITDKQLEKMILALIHKSMADFMTDGQKMVGDKSTVQDCFVIRRAFPRSKILAIMRDGRDVAVSFAFHLHRRGSANKLSGDDKIDLNYLELVAKAWALYAENLYEFSQKKDDGFMLVKYEELLQDPEPLTSAMFDFLNVENSKELVKEIVGKNSFEALTGGRKAGELDKDSFYRKGIVGDWKNYFGPTELKIWNDFASAVAKKWGYN